jgi:5'-nucleotidase
VDEDDITYIDFVSEGRRLAAELREGQGVDLVVALTHMREPNDMRLAEEVEGIDLVLGWVMGCFGGWDAGWPGVRAPGE